MPAFIAVGLDHTTAGIELRERVAFADAEIPAALERLTDPADGVLDQAAILSTCNRVEVYGIARRRTAERRLVAVLARRGGVAAAEIAGKLYVYRDEQVAHRLAETAAGLHSLVLGEAQIQGQIRRALEHALIAGSAGAELRRLFESAAVGGRRVRAHTAIGRGAASVPGAAVELAYRRVGALSQSTVLLVGTGSVGTLVAKHLVKRGVKELLVFGRTAARAESLAESSGGRAIAPDRLESALAQSDVVITATGAACPVLHRDQVRRAVARRGVHAEPLLMIDLSVPRDVDPAATDLPGIELQTIDDLRDIAERALVQRRAELPEAYAILGSEVSRFTDWLRRRDAIAHVGAAQGRAGPTLGAGPAIETSGLTA